MRNLLKLVLLLARSSDKLGYSQGTAALLIASGIVAGAASTALLVVINATLSRSGSTTAALGWLFAGLCVILPLARFVSQVLLVRLSQGLTFDLRMHLSSSILSAPLRQLERLGAARLLVTLTDDVERITVALSNLPLLVLQVTVVLGCLVYMGWLSWSLLLLVVAAVVLGVASYQLPILAAMKRFKLARAEEDQLFAHFRGLTQGTKELKIHRSRREAFLLSLLRPTAQSMREHYVSGGFLYAAANSWGQVLFFVVIGLILYVVSDFRHLEPGLLTGYTLSILYMLTPLDVILGQLPNLSRATVAIDKIQELGLSPAAMSAEAGAAALPVHGSAWRELNLKGVTHSFFKENEEDIFTLGPIDLTLTAGELVFLVGGNGSGKTTLGKLLVGLYTPESGEIHLDGKPVDDSSRESYRQLYSVVFSDFFLFETLLGLERPVLDESARRYLARLHLDRKVKVENGALSTLDLSQGQRKRLALLTAYLEDRPIYLFDEWAADQDPQFKEIFYLQLLPELRSLGKTVVVISHDDRYYGMADRIIKLDFGRIEYDGNVEDYLQASAMWQAAAAQAK